MKRFILLAAIFSFHLLGDAGHVINAAEEQSNERSLVDASSAKDKRSTRRQLLSESQQHFLEGDVASAFSVTSRLLQINRELFGAKDDRVAWQLQKLAIYSLELEQPEKALHYAEECAKVVRSAHFQDSWQFEEGQKFIRFIEAVTTLPRTKRQRFLQAEREVDVATHQENWQSALEATQYRLGVLIELFGERHSYVASELLSAQYLLVQMRDTDAVIQQLRRLEKLIPQISIAPNPDFARLYYIWASLAHNNEDVETAERYYLRAIELLSEAGQLFGVDCAAVHNDYAVLLDDLERFEEALRHYRIASDLYAEDLNTTDVQYGTALENLTRLEQSIGLEAVDKHQWDKAEEHLRRAFEVATTSWGKQDYRALEFDADLKRLDRIRAMSPEEIEQFDRLAELLDEASALEESGEFDKLESLARERHEIAAKLFGENSLEAVRAKFIVAWLLPYGDESETAYRALANSYRKLLGQEHSEYADVLLELVRQASTLNEATLFKAKQAVEIYSSIYGGKASYEYASALSLYGRLLRKVGGAETEKTLLEAQSRWRNLGETAGPEYVDVLYDLSWTYRWLQKQPTKAMPLATQAVDIAREIPDYDSSELAILLQELALVHDAIGDEDRAIELYLESLNLKRELVERDECAFRQALYNVGIEYYLTRDYVAAEKYFRELFDLDQSDPAGCYDSSLKGARYLADTYRLLEKYGEASQVLDEFAESIDDDSHLDRGVANEYRAWIEIQRIEIHKNRKQLESARAQLNKLWAQLSPSTGETAPSENRGAGADQISPGAWGTLLAKLIRLADEVGAFGTGVSIRETYLNHVQQNSPDKPWLIADAKRDLEEARLWRGLREEQRQELESADKSWKKALKTGNADFIQVGLPLMQQAIAKRTKHLGESHSLVVSSQSTMAMKLGRSGKLDDGYQLAQRVLTIREQLLGGEHLQTAKAKIEVAGLAARFMRLDEAKNLFQQALAVQSRILGPDHSELAIAYYGLSIIHLGKGNHSAALSAASEASRRYESLGRSGSREYARALIMLCNIYEVLGEKKKSFDTLLKCQSIVTENFKPTDPLCLDCKLLLATRASGYANSRKRAGELFEELLATLKTAKLDRTEKYASTLRAYGDLRKFRKEFQQARDLFQESLDLLHDIYDQPVDLNIANTHHRLGLVSLSLGDLPAADSHFEAAHELFSKLVGEESYLIANSLYQLARVKALQQQSEAAHEYLLASLKVEKQTLDEKFLLGSDDAIAKVLDSGAGKYALLLTMQAIGQAPPNTVESDYSWTLQRKGRALDMACRMQTAKRSLAHHPEIVKTLAEIQSLRRSLSQATIADTDEQAEPGGTSTRQANLKRIARLQEQLALKVRDTGIDIGQSGVDVAKIRQRLPRDSALIEFVFASLIDLDSASNKWTPQHVLAFFVPAESTIPCRFVDLGPAAEIRSLIKKLRTHIERLPRSIRLSSEADLEQQYQALSLPLFQRLLGPFENELAKLKSIVLAPDSDLHRVPFSALCRKEGRYLIEDVTVSYVSSGRDLLRDHALPGQGTLILADPDYDATGSERAAVAATMNYQRTEEPVQLALRGSAGELRSLRWRSLPGARQEAEDVRLLLDNSAYLPVQSYVGEQAVEEILKSTISPRLVHIATHGFYVPYQKAESSQPLEQGRGSGTGAGLGRLRRDVNPLLRSGIVLAGANQLTRKDNESIQVDDGWVTAQEIASMDFRNTELVVLSACESGLGEAKRGHGVHGLRRALLIAGAHNLMTSLFEVPDSETRELMGEFYGALVTNRQAATALQQAQLAMIKRRRTELDSAHPFYWASFFVLGKPDNSIDAPISSARQ